MQFPALTIDFTSIALPVIISLSIVIVFWVILLCLSYLIKIMSKRWLESEYSSKETKITENKNSYIKNFMVQRRHYIINTLSALRWFLTIYILLNILSDISKSIANEFTKAHINSKVLSDEFSVFVNYLQKIQLHLNQLSDFLVSTFFIALLAIWAIILLQDAMNAMIFSSSKKGKIEFTTRMKARRETLYPVTRNLLRLIISVIALFTILQNIGVNVAALMATAGIASVALGFGAQSLVKDFIGGFFILFEDQFAVGDQIEVNGFSGTVENMTLRCVRIRTNEGSLTLIPNGDIRSIKNYSTNWARIDFKILVPVLANLDLATEILQNEAICIHSDFKREIIEVPDVRSVDKLLDFENKTDAVLFRVYIKTISTVSKTKIEREFNKRISKRFIEEGILLATTNSLKSLSQNSSRSPIQLQNKAEPSS